MSTLSISNFMTKLKNQDKTDYQKVMCYLLQEYGTSLHCNRFAIGNCNEYAIADLIKETGLHVEVLQNAKRIDIYAVEFGKFSIKYSGGGNVKLHNSNNTTNTDLSMVDTLLVTPTEWWFLSPDSMKEYGVDLQKYLKNTGDGLELNRGILAELKRKAYPHFFEYKLETDKKKCKHQEINKIIYEVIKGKIASP